jgi:arylsulfatase A-like enzyme
VPYLPPDAVLSTYDSESYSGPVNFNRDRELLEKIKVGRVTLNARDKRRLEALYDAEITYHDVHMASILEGLERRGLAQDTLVIITSDHGEEFYDHGSVGHGHTLYEELLHVPLVVRWPGLESAPSRIDTPAGLVDVLPTIYDALGREVPAELPGHSLVPLLRGDLPHAPPVVLSGFMQGWRASLSGHHKFVQRAASRFAFYDLEADPHEQHDLAAERPLSVRWLRGMLGLMLHGEESPARRAETQERTRIDPETEAQLRALGYVGTSAP